MKNPILNCLKNMNRVVLFYIVALVIVYGSFVVLTATGGAYSQTTYTTHGIHHRQQTTTCVRTGLTGPAAQENDFYCKDFPIIAPSTYNEVIDFAIATNYIMGTAQKVFESIDWPGCPITVVRFDRGGHAEHHNLNSPCAKDLLVRLYDNNNKLLWTEA